MATTPMPGDVNGSNTADPVLNGGDGRSQRGFSIPTVYSAQVSRTIELRNLDPECFFFGSRMDACHVIEYRLLMFSRVPELGRDGQSGEGLGQGHGSCVSFPFTDDGFNLI